MSSTKRETKDFHVVVVQWRQRDVQKIKAWCPWRARVFSLSKPIDFLPFSVTSPSSLLKLPNRVFSDDVKAAILVSQTNPLLVQLFFHANVSFCSNKFAKMLATWVKTLYRDFKQRRFWATLVSLKWTFFLFNMPLSYVICIAKCLYSARDELLEYLFKITT